MASRSSSSVLSTVDTSVSCNSQSPPMLKDKERREIASTRAEEVVVRMRRVEYGYLSGGFPD